MAFLHGIKAEVTTDGLRPLEQVSTSVIGLIGTAPDADPALFPMDEPVLVQSPVEAAGLDTTQARQGTLVDAMNATYLQTAARVVVVRVAEGLDEAATLTNMVGSAVSQTGVHAFIGAESHVGYRPKIFAAAGWSHQRPGDAANPVVAAAKGIADKVRGIVVQDGPSTNQAAALQAANDAGSDRVLVVDPFVTVAGPAGLVHQPPSAFVAGVIARTDAEIGPWASPSNRVINGILGTARPIGFAMSDPTTETNALNEGKVATIIRRNGFRLWGNLGTGSDAATQFIAVRRALDMVLDMLEDSHLWALDLPISGQLLNDVQASVDSGLRQLRARGATLVGTVALNPDLNTVTSFQNGEAWWDVQIEPPAPLQTMRFRVRRTPEAYETLLQGAA